MSAGRGWIALALVVFATWVPLRVLLGAYLVGAVWIMGLYAQGLGVNIAPQFLAALPYLVTIAALVLISRNRALAKVNTPTCIGQAFVALFPYAHALFDDDVLVHLGARQNELT